MKLDEIVFLQKRVLELIQDYKILLWGAGPHIADVVDKINNLGQGDSIVGVFDSTRKLDASPVEGIPVIATEELRKLSHDDHIVIGCAGLNELYGYIVPEHLFYFRIIHRRALETSLELAERFDELQINVDLFTDDLSKELYLQRLKLILSSVMFDESFKTIGGPYARNELIENFGEKWLYAGAYNGKHLDRALGFKSDQEIVAVEPSPKMYEALRNRFFDRSNVQIHNYLLWSESGLEISFNDDSAHQGLAASVFVPEEFGASSRINTITVDDLLGDQVLSDLSLDVEGSEQHAVRGAKKVLANGKTRCSVCIYHNLDDYLKVPPLMAEMMDPKTLAVRHHSCIPFIETVVYGLPC